MEQLCAPGHSNYQMFIVRLFQHIAPISRKKVPKKLIDFASPLNNATGAENSSDMQLSSLYAAAAADGDVASALAAPT